MTAPAPASGAAARPATWLAALGPRGRVVAALALGAIAALGQAPVNLWPLTILGLAGLTLLAAGRPAPRAAALTWWLGGTGYFGLALSWIVEPFLVDIARHGWMAPFALVLMAGGMALFWGLAGFVAHATRLRGWPLAALTALCLTLAGVLRGVIFTGFPWALPGHALIASPALHLAQWGGAIGLTLLVTGLAATLPLALARTRTALLWLAVLAVAMGGGAVLQAPPGDLQGRPVVRLVQPNVAQADKWNPMLAPGHFQALLDLTATEGVHDLTVWPETAIPAWLDEIPHLMPVIADAAGNAPVAFGINRGEGARIYNSLVLLDGQGSVAETYDKHHLVPFGEYVPMGDVLGQLGIRGMAAREGNGFSAGPGARLIDIPGVGRALPLICYEGVFPRDLAAAPARPDLLLLITNDAWFGTVSGPYQHMAQARLRAVEQGLPMIRVANTGVSGVIDPGGRITGRMRLGETGIRDVPLPPPAAATPYARIGDLPLTLLLLAAALLLAAIGRRDLWANSR